MNTLMLKIKNIFLGEIVDEKKFSNQRLVDKVVECFKVRLDTCSLSDSLIYDMNFLIFVPSKYFDEVCVHLPILTRSMVKSFYQIIQTERRKRPFYIPLTNFWTFRVAPLDMSELGEGDITIFGQATAEKTWGETLEQDANLGSVSINGKHSSYAKFHLNSRLFQGVDALEKGCLRIKFNPALSLDEPSTKNAKSQARTSNLEKDLARITFTSVDGSRCYVMRQKMLRIGKAQGKDDISSQHRLSIHTEEISLVAEHFLLAYQENSRSLSYKKK